MKKNERSSAPKEINAFLGESTTFKGLLSFEGTVRIDGKVEGEIVTKDTLVVGEKAEIKAEIKVGTVIINGKVYGNIVATERIEIRSAAEGVIFNGKCQMTAPTGNQVQGTKTILHDRLAVQDAREIQKKKEADLEEIKA